MKKDEDQQNQKLEYCFPLCLPHLNAQNLNFDNVKEKKRKHKVWYNSWGISVHAFEFS